ncbi:hypothetical protein A2U01_0040040, partial [Trifolium medium]|nr:hypothetical protein [Trifolium medium]
MEQPKEKSECYQIDLVDNLVKEQFEESPAGVEKVLVQSLEYEDNELDEETNLSVKWLEDPSDVPSRYESLKELPPHLKYIFLREGNTQPAIISNALSKEAEDKPLSILKKNKAALGWSIDDLKGISPAYCMHKIKLEEEYKPVVQPQRRLNPAMSEVVKKEVEKLKAAGMIYPISDSPW